MVQERATRREVFGLSAEFAAAILQSNTGQTSEAGRAPVGTRIRSRELEVSHFEAARIKQVQFVRTISLLEKNGF